jgi:hypothetical protein
MAVLLGCGRPVSATQHEPPSGVFGIHNRGSSGRWETEESLDRERHRNAFPREREPAPAAFIACTTRLPEPPLVGD